MLKIHLGDNRPYLFKKLKAAIPIWINFFDFPDEQKQLLLQIGSLSIDRVLKPHRQQRGMSSTKPSLFRHRVPIELVYWSEFFGHSFRVQNLSHAATFSARYFS